MAIWKEFVNGDESRQGTTSRGRPGQGFTPAGRGGPTDVIPGLGPCTTSHHHLMVGFGKEAAQAAIFVIREACLRPARRGDGRWLTTSPAECMIGFTVLSHS